MIVITNKNKVTRHYKHTDYYAIYTDIVHCINPNVDLANVDKKTHNIASSIASWCELATYGEECYIAEEYGIEILCYDKDLGTDYDYTGENDYADYWG